MIDALLVFLGTAVVLFLLAHFIGRCIAMMGGEEDE
jgi:hypothetical protein